MSSQVSSDESYIQGCAFHDGFSPAIGVFGTAGLFVDDNVVHHTVGEGKTICRRSLTATSNPLGRVIESCLCVSVGIRIWGNNITLRRNLVMLTLWPGSYQNREEPFNFDWNAAIEVGLLKLQRETLGRFIFFNLLAIFSGQRGHKRCAATQHSGRIRKSRVSYRWWTVSRYDGGRCFNFYVCFNWQPYFSEYKKSVMRKKKNTFICRTGL